jgi:hypothetical protein
LKVQPLVDLQVRAYSLSASADFLEKMVKTVFKIQEIGEEKKMDSEKLKNPNVLSTAQAHIAAAIESILPYKEVFDLEGDAQEARIDEISKELISQRVSDDTSGKSTAEVLKNQSWYINTKVRSVLDRLLEDGLTKETINKMIDEEYDNIIVKSVDQEEASEIILGKLIA